jgi:hypothetical protein
VSSTVQRLPTHTVVWDDNEKVKISRENYRKEPNNWEI